MNKRFKDKFMKLTKKEKDLVKEEQKQEDKLTWQQQWDIQQIKLKKIMQMNHYFSQFCEDKWLDENTKLPTTGFYVDIGANNPYNLSNTAFLRHKGWSGIQIDANPIFKPYWSTLGLTLDINILSTSNSAKFKFDSNPDLSGISESGELKPAISINDWFSSHNVTNIDLLSIDIEGSEYDVLSTLDWNRYKPTIIIFEHRTQERQDHRLCKVLEERGYKLAHTTFANHIYII